MPKKPADLGAPTEPGGEDGAAQDLIHVRATAHLPRHPLGYLPALERGGEALVDADDPYIRDLLGAGWLIPLGDPDELRRGE